MITQRRQESHLNLHVMVRMVRPEIDSDRFRAKAFSHVEFWHCMRVGRVLWSRRSETASERERALDGCVLVSLGNTSHRNRESIPSPVRDAQEHSQFKRFSLSDAA